MDNLTLPQQLARRDLDRMAAYRENLDFYHGAQWTGRPRRRERQLTFNYAKVFVDKVTSYLMAGMRVVAEPLEEAGREQARRAQEALDQMSQANHLEQLDFDTELDVAILGDGCFKVTWDAGGRRVRVSAPDVQGVFVWWAGDDPSRLWRVASRYVLEREEAEALYQLRLPRPAFGSGQVTVVETWTERELQLWADSQLLEQKPNPYGFIPFVVYPNLREPKRFWGISDIRPSRSPPGS